jgi:D-glycero-alpha-D-manno-heptose-7-phosphate kinase
LTIDYKSILINNVQVIKVKAPTRIDLAGGTLDLWPLSTLFAPAVCINLAINLYAEVEARQTRGGRGVTVRSVHHGKTLTLQAGRPEKQKTLFDRVHEYFTRESFTRESVPVSGWEFTVNTGSPVGAGLGGSSSLVVALIKVMCRISGKKMTGQQVIELAKNIEARHLGIPTGIQDYVAALQGGVSVIDIGEGGMVPRRMKADTKSLEKRLVLAYSGRSRISGKANWHMFKRAIDGDPSTVKVFKGIAQNSLDVAEALDNGRWNRIGPLMDKENRLREKLGPAVIPPKIKKVFVAIRKKGGYPKICGAGGGGCFVVYCEEGARDGMRSLLKENGCEPLDFRTGTPSVKTLS